MPNYAYKALDTTGRSTEGSVGAVSRSSALDQLARQGLSPVWVQEQDATAPVIRRQAPAGGRVPATLAESFVRELSNLLAGGVPLGRSLNILCREATHSAAKYQWAAIQEDVVGGTPLADAMARWPRTFPAVQVAMVRAGETGGFLELVLSQIAEFRSRERDLKGRLKGAMVYPAALAVVCVAVLIFLMTFFIPKFKGIFESVNGTLPALTRAIMAVSDVVTHYGLVVLVVVVAAVLFIRRALASQAGRRSFERFILRVPAVGIVLSRFALVRFCRMLGTLLGAGVPLVSALKVSRQAIGNQILFDALGESIDQVQRGSSLATSLAACPILFPPSVTEVVAVAEESGRLDQELNRLSVTHESELDRRLRMLVTLAEPVMLFIMASIVGTVVIGMLLPVFTIEQYIK